MKGGNDKIISTEWKRRGKGICFSCKKETWREIWCRVSKSESLSGKSQFRLGAVEAVDQVKLDAEGVKNEGNSGQLEGVKRLSLKGRAQGSGSLVKESGQDSTNRLTMGPLRKAVNELNSVNEQTLEDKSSYSCRGDA